MKRNLIYGTMIACGCFFATMLKVFSQTAESTHPQNAPEWNQNQNPAATGVVESIPMDLHSVMRNNLNDIQKLEMTGLIDEDFTKIMAHHHKGAIDMAKVYLTSGQDSELREMAEGIIDRKKKQISKLETFAAKARAKNKNQEGSKALITPVNRLISTSQEMELAGGIDRQFATLMVEHFKAGIEIAEVEIKKGNYPEIKEMAKKLKEEQKQASEKLKNWLSLHK